MTDNGVTIPPWTGARRAAAHTKVRAKGRRLNLPCCLCGDPIDYDVLYPDPKSMSVQHIKARAIWPELTWDENNWAPAHLDCNKRAGDGTNARNNLGVITPIWAITNSQPETQQRIVVLLAGPPGAGKTTAAHQSGLTVFDRDDDHWADDTDFDQALTNLGRTPYAQAVVIRSCPTSTARQRVQHQIGATHTRLVTVPIDASIQRVTQRGRQDRVRTIAAITSWWNRHDNNDHTPTWTGWNADHTPT